jgi:hypothetical protein
MTRAAFRRIACVGAMLGLGVASSPQVQAAPAAPVTPVTAAAVSTNHATAPAATALDQPNATGRGWGAMIACAGCIIAAGVVVGSGPGAIAIALNAPGSAIALLACAAACYEAFQ